MSKGKITICGTGPTTYLHLTVEVLEFLKDFFSSADTQKKRIYSLLHPIEVIEKLPFYKPHLVRDLSSLYLVPDIERKTVYKTISKIVVKRALLEGFHVVFLVAGSPFVLNDPVLLVRKLASIHKIDLEILHGMSFIDLILEHTYWDGHSGLVFASGWNIINREVKLNPEMPTIIYQIGEFTEKGEAILSYKNIHALTVLKNELSQIFGADHVVKILYSSGYPQYRNLVKEIPILKLDEKSVPVYSNLYVPPVKKGK